ncbi:hypothetical protein DN069_23015 [Streptacidiphilus pinicola]|uniref:Uncharacterized protein n=1 Tax=Streptacidiphilus pinicola TaxID=2219663 RepID=A0A2X0J755_9ACTN|nr:hypothetical protein [Streptacidiphilus pinicola]RAG83268.1 hypothetical protein DN069_23015 [Streptacidiphilus pinicola]
MSTVGEPQDSVPADGGTMQLRAQPEDAPPAPQDAVPAEPDVVPTVRLPAEPEAVPTVRLPGGSEAVPTPTLQLPVEPQAAPAPAPTLVVPVGPTMVELPAQPAAAPQAAPEVTAPVSEPGLIRFGPGVPDPKTARTIAVWKGEIVPEPEEAGKKRRGWLFWVPVALVFLALLFWWLDGLLAPPPLRITGVSVQAAPATVGCGGKGTVVATVTTDGRAGSFRYRWTRNDGTDSGLLTETVAAGTRQVQLPLIWTLSGPGTFAARATLRIEGHPGLTGAAGFSYACAG